MTTFEFRPVTESDLPMLADWLARPHVREWWRSESLALDALREEFIVSDVWIPAPGLAPEPRDKRYIARRDGEPVGYIQSYVAYQAGQGWWEGETDPGVRGIDQFLADGTRLGKGIGTEMVGAFVDSLLADPMVTHVQTDPDPANPRAIRCYEKVGFKRVGEVETPDGVALLMRCTRADRLAASRLP